MVVMKFGGTSVGSAENIKHVASLLMKRNDTMIVVLSAMSGTTNKLLEICSAYRDGDNKKAEDIIDGLRLKYEKEVSNLFNSKYWCSTTQKIVDERLENLRKFEDDIFTTFEEKQIVAEGEIISTTMMVNYLKEQNADAELLSALDYMRTDNFQNPDMKQTALMLQEQLNHLGPHQIIVTQGFICRNAFDEIDNLKRGGSDYTATIIGSILKSNVEIWTDIDGVHNADPRIVNNTFPIPRLSYEEASELAYYGAKILHPTCVKPARAGKVQILLKNTLQPEAAGTVIGEESHIKTNSSNGIKAIALKVDIAVVHIACNSNFVSMTTLYTKAVQILDAYDSNIYACSCSEQGISLCIEESEDTLQIIEELRQTMSVTIEYNNAIVTVVGSFEQSGILAQMMKAIDNLQIRMVSLGGKRNCISFVIDDKDKSTAMQALCDTLFSK